MFNVREKIYSYLPKQKQKELYRQAFSSVVGRKVLTDMLIDLCFFDEIEEEEGVSAEEKNHLRNYATKLLRKCGILNGKNTELIVSALMKMPIK